MNSPRNFVHEMAPVMFMKSTVGGGDESSGSSATPGSTRNAGLRAGVLLWDRPTSRPQARRSRPDGVLFVAVADSPLTGRTGGTGGDRFTLGDGITHPAEDLSESRGCNTQKTTEGPGSHKEIDGPTLRFTLQVNGPQINLRRTQAKVTVTQDAVLPRLSEVGLGRTRQMTGSLRFSFSSRTSRAKTQ
jgi:hypothetical protein